MRKLHWGELTSAEFRDLDPERVVAVAPIAAIEQHGPHLPVFTDTSIADGMLRETISRFPADIHALFLPIMAIGKSNEHIRAPGTLTLSAHTALDSWLEVGESVRRAGLRKLVFVNSHGGNADVLAIVARELRVRHDMLCVYTSWRRFGFPAGLYTAEEDRHGIHAGDIETSLMLHFRPDLVRMDRARNFPSIAAAMEKSYKYLRPTGLPAFAWMSPDLNPDGAVGDASLATVEKGRATAEHQARGFIELLREVASFPLASLAAP